MDTKLTSAAFVAAILASSVTWAQQSTSDSSVCKEKPTSASKAKTKTTKHKGAAEPSSSKAKSSEQEKSTDLGSELQEEQTKNEAEAEKPRPKEPTSTEKAKEAKKTEEPVGTTRTTAAQVIGGAARDVTNAVDQPGKFNPVAITYNPLSLFIGRVSFNVEWAPATHHVIIASPHFATTGATIAIGPNETVDQHIIGGGGELGYRYYTGHRGMNGVFIGPSLIGGGYSADLPSGNKAFTNVGGAVDVGVQAVLLNHLALGAGVGIEYLHVSHDFHDLPTSPASLAQSGIKPRLLAQGGYAF
jgi:hypothetical protein